MTATSNTTETHTKVSTTTAITTYCAMTKAAKPLESGPAARDTFGEVTLLLLCNVHKVFARIPIAANASAEARVTRKREQERERETRRERERRQREREEKRKTRETIRSRTDR